MSEEHRDSILANGEWRDFSTAPKDGTNILAWQDGCEWPEVIRYELYNDQDLEEECGEPGFWRYSEDLLADVASVEQDEFALWMPIRKPGA